MASISKRPSKSGMTYRIQVKIKDKGSGEIKVHSTTWKPPVGLTPKQMEREVVIFASEYENAIKALETASGEPTQSAETTFSDYALWWLKRRKNEVAVSYFVNCESAIELTNKHIGGYKLKELTPNIIQQYYDKLDRMGKTVTVVTAKPALRERMNQTGIGYMKLRYEKNFSSCSLSNALAGKQISYEYAKRLAQTLGEKTENLFNVTHTTQKYAYETISKIKRTIRAVLATAKKQRLIADNYASADYITFPKRPPRDIDYMDDEDAKKFYKAADEFPDIRYKTAMLTLLLTGMRRGELCGLEWSDIDFDNATITIARSFGIAVLDINNLKEVNDTYGHSLGNELISVASRIICDTFKKSPVFRIGGDEFCVILQHRDLADIEKLFDNFDAECATTYIDKDNVKFPVSIAKGFAEFDPQNDTRFFFCFQWANQADQGDL